MWPPTLCVGDVHVCTFRFFSCFKLRMNQGQVYPLESFPHQQLVPTKLKPRAGMNRQPHGWLAASESAHLLGLLSCCVLGALYSGMMALAQLARVATLPPENHAFRKLAVSTTTHHVLQSNVMLPFLIQNMQKAKVNHLYSLVRKI